eukprot:TRINITY_DN597_c0_g2_i3.p1 TRINITY_DN597_c0_g2~~TRINITY_DN597_c0_g2_i3.p1  ORF type:complete len:131 (+),score=29.49 TRINITY_DN597_c0_g2_i3:37-429(+)
MTTPPVSSSPKIISFKKESSAVERVTLYQKIKASFPDKIPIIVEKAPGADVPQIKKRKFLSPGDIPLSQFLEEVRVQIPRTAADQAVVFLFDDNTGVPNAAMTMEQIYEAHASPEDGFLYIVYTTQTIFG